MECHCLQNKTLSTIFFKLYLQLSQQWLSDRAVEKKVKLSDSLTMTTFIKFVASDISLRRVPATSGALFNVKISTVLK
jgi:hypothetical protein